MKRARVRMLSVLGLGVVLLVTSLSGAGDSDLKILQQWKILNSGVKGEKSKVILSTEEWEAEWKQAHSRSLPMPDVPKVDFRKQMVLAFHIGAKRTSGYAVEIRRVEKLQHGLKVHVREKKPNGDVVSPALTAPSCFALIPKENTKVTFIRDRK
ncbi:MAG: protease complex subunit PrcB family protein [bacterium]|nr:protease complex subunit PrcB family protein [bacterium]